MPSKANQAVLRALSGRKDEYLSGQKLAEMLGMSRAAIWKHIQQLREQGYQIEAAPNKGYKLIEKPITINSIEITTNLQEKAAQFNVHYFETVESTNKVADQLARDGAAEGTVVVAARQSAGRGRLDRSWSSPQGGIWLSLILRPAIPVADIARITLLSAVAVSKTLREYGAEALIKWPNDIVVGDKKICGTLIELAAEQDRVDYIVVGIGINVNLPVEDLPEEVSDSATTLRRLFGHDIDINKLAANLLEHFIVYYERLKSGEWESIRQEWLENSIHTGTFITVRTLTETLHGAFAGIDDYGALLLELDDGSIRKFASGDVTLKHS